MVGAPGLLAHFNVEEIFTLAHFGAGLAMPRVLGEAESEQPVRVAVEFLEVGGLAQLVLRSAAVLAVEAVAGDEATDAAHGDTGQGTGRAARAPGVAVAARGSPGFGRGLRS